MIEALAWGLFWWVLLSIIVAFLITRAMGND